jgi:hypothetical protein
MADEKNTPASGDKATVEVTGAVVGDKPEPANTPTTLGSGKASAASKTPAGRSKGLDTVDQTAKAWVGSGAKADASTKGMDAPSGDELREDHSETDRNLAKDNIENMANGNSNHNTVAGVNPVAVAQMDRPDYNPQRRPSSRANMASTVGEHPELMAARIEAKKTAPTNSEIVTDRRVEANEDRDRPLADYKSPFIGEQ